MHYDNLYLGWIWGVGINNNSLTICLVVMDTMIVVNIAVSVVHILVVAVTMWLVVVVVGN